MMDQAWLKRIAQIQGLADEPDSPIRPTEVFNEGWMLRLLLDWMAAEGRSDHPLSFDEAARWSSEAVLPSSFLPRRRGDPHITRLLSDN